MFGKSSQTHGWHDGEQSHSPASFLEDHVSDCGISYAHMSPLLDWSPSPQGKNCLSPSFRLPITHRKSSGLEIENPLTESTRASSCLKDSQSLLNIL